LEGLSGMTGGEIVGLLLWEENPTMDVVKEQGLPYNGCSEGTGIERNSKPGT